MTRRLRLGVLLSGGGTTLKNLLEHIGDGRLQADVATVIADRPGTRGQEIARHAAIDAHLVARRDFKSLDEFSREIERLLDTAQVDLVCLAGFLSLWRISESYLGRVMNIHPALIPSFCGRGMFGHHVHEAVVKSGVKISGCTVHFADNQYDHGPIILQRTVPVHFDDTPDDVAARVFQQECQAYPEAIRLFAEGRLKIEDHRVRIL